jgi:glycosyltransferase involved in cell wall biosynthesis
MKILWISHDPVRESITECDSTSGFWKEALLELLIKETNNEIKVAYPSKKPSKLLSGNYTFRFPKKKRYKNLPKVSKSDLLDVINDYKPDLIHIHGTEKPYGLIAEFTDVPILISLQGFISECYNSLLADISLSIWDKEKTLKERLFRNSFIDLHKNWYYNSAYEKQLVKINKNFAGRTIFDNDFIRKHNSAANYFKGNELLRDVFYNEVWNVNEIEEFSIYTSSFGNPLKGFHILLEAVGFLKEEFPTIKVTVPGVLSNRLANKYVGNSYYRIVKKMITSYGLGENVNFAGKLNGEEVSKILKKSHVFVMPSFIENSSNALGEAQITGTPCVVSSNCGGTPTLIGDNGLVFRKGDAFDLSKKIRTIFLDSKMAIELSKKGRSFGNCFHDKTTIKKQYTSIYHSIINDESIIK